MSKRAVVGALVTLARGADRREHVVRSGGGYISQCDLRLHFGLGTAKKPDTLTVRWPSGLVETLRDLPANQYYAVREGSGIDPKQTRGVSNVRIKTPAIGPR